MGSRCFFPKNGLMISPAKMIEDGDSFEGWRVEIPALSPWDFMGFKQHTVRFVVVSSPNFNRKELSTLVCLKIL
jgi:hypothetical protein